MPQLPFDRAYALFYGQTLPRLLAGVLVPLRLSASPLPSSASASLGYL